LGAGSRLLAAFARHETAAGLVLTALIVVPGAWAMDTVMAWGYTPGVRIVAATDLDLDGAADVAERKRRFFAFMRPVVEGENARLARQRARLIEARRTGQDRRWVRKMARRYRVAWPGSDAAWEELLARVDTLPVELALVQAAQESRWGRSRFAIDGNNMFGQWCYRAKCGIVPLERAEGATHKVAAFAHVNEAVRNYLYNINVGHAYGELRRIRAAIRDRGETPDALSLAEGLERYSEGRAAYVEKIKRMIRLNWAAMALTAG
jgi:Bax protein